MIEELDRRIAQLTAELERIKQAYLRMEGGLLALQELRNALPVDKPTAGDVAADSET